jgi:hypothetical protein
MELVNISYTGTGTEAQNYSNLDNSLISNNYINTSFLANSNDYIEAFVYDDSNNLLNSDYNLTDYTLPSNSNSNNSTYASINLDPQTYVNNLGFDRGSINVQYNFLRNLFNSSFSINYWIKQISSTRTELLLASQNISDSNILNGFNSYQSYAANKNYFSDFYLNFGNNQLIIAVNVAYSSDSNGAYLLIKLYEPLPLDFDVKSTLWIVDKIAESANYNVNIQIEADAINNQNNLRGPNFKVEINQKLGLTTPYYNYNNLLSSPVTSSFQKLMSYYQDQAININIDYTDFSNFIHFSSATERINNFVYKLGLIESYTSQIQAQKSVTGGNLVASSSIGFLSQSINNIITNFDIYEYYLYYASESFAWPKTNKTQPYTLAPINSTASLNWLGSSTTVPTGNNISILYSASYYDLTNKDLLVNTIPRYLQDDPNNIPYSTFIYMIGQHFDNIWVYYKDVTNRYNNTNNPNTGVSMDLVGDALRGLGIHLYTNSNISNNLYYSLFGINADGSLLPPTGSEKITNYVTSSIATLPAQTIQNEIYKRLYHNLPYLLKTKGTHRGLKALIACYGIPESILTVNEFGGYDSSVQDGVLEINNLKVYTVTSSLQISSSVLSPYVSNQYYQTNRRLNSSKIEVGFSPADSINDFITSSLGYFNIDQLIGNPIDQYSASYPTLDAFKDTTFSTYATYPNHSIGEYIRMIKFYNNSLFKMIKDFVPARADISTGIIVKPHILERSKYARHEPTITSSSLVTEISGSKISGSDPALITKPTSYVKNQYTTLGIIPISQSVGFEKFTGEFSGSNFRATHHNKSQIEKSYQPFQNLTLGYTPSQSINFGALYQNFSNSVRSNTFFHLDFGGVLKNQATNYGYITQSIVLGNSYQSNPNSQYAYLQDYNYNLRRSIIPRYSGSFSMAKAYNVYTTASGNYYGDITYGNDPMIKYYSNKLALFTQVETSSFIPGQINATLAYLVDVSGGLQELNQNNTHWTDVQNIFKSGKSLTIKQFDNKKYGNQKGTDGVKTIYNSGYSYSPELYFVSGVDTQLFFTYVDNSIVSNFIAWNPSTTDVPGSNQYINGGGGSPYYAPFITNAPTRTGNIYKAFIYSNPSVGYYPYNASTNPGFPYYTPKVAGVSNFTAKFSLTVTLPDPQTQGGSTNRAVYAYQVYLNNNLLPGSSVQLMDFSSTYSPAVINNSRLTLVANTNPTTSPINSNATNFVRTGQPDITISVPTTGPIDIYNGTTFIGTFSALTDFVTFTSWYWQVPGIGFQNGYLASACSFAISQYVVPYVTSPVAGKTSWIQTYTRASSTPATSNYSKTFNINYTTPSVAITPSDKVYFQLIQQSVDTSNYTSYLSVGASNSSLGLNTAAVGAGGYPYATSSFDNGNFIYSALNNAEGTTGSLVLSQNLSNYLGYQFVPYFVSASVVYSSSLYSLSASYGDVSYTFQPQFGDRIVLSDGNKTENLDVVGYNIDSNNRVNISVIPTILSSWVSNPNSILQFLLLRKFPDEQNIQLTFIKKPGQTSYGFLIPDNINPEVLLKINTIQSQVQSQLLSTQVNTNI